MSGARIVLIITAAQASAALAGITSLALDLPRIWPGMLLTAAGAAIAATQMTRHMDKR